VDGKSEVGGFPVIRKPMRQWMLRITAYAERLINDLEALTGRIRSRKCSGIGLGGARGPKSNLESRIQNPESRVHNASGHAFRRDLYGAFAGTQDGGYHHDAGASRCDPGLQNGSLEKVRLGTHRIGERKDGVFTGAYAIIR